MKTNFFEELKRVILSEHKDDKYFIQYVRYYELLLQNKDVLKPLLNDMEQWRVDIQFSDDKTDGYTYGTYQIYLWDFDGEVPDNDDYSYRYGQKSADYYYEIELTREERLWGYCECTPDMKGYNPKYNCCGNGCDWVAPAFTLRKIEERNGRFTGQEKDMWELEEKWIEHLDSYNKKKKEERLQNIEDQLARLIQEKENILKENKLM